MIPSSSLPFRSVHNVLQNIFRINRTPANCETPTEYETRADYETVLELKIALNDTKKISNIIFRPNKLTFSQFDFRREFFDGVIFKNVSFSYTEITGINFKDCKFVDCQFLGTNFVDCEFHGCSFQGCDPLKITFTNTYINPQLFVDMLDKSTDANKGLWLFQQLYNNAANTHQPDFERIAEFNMRKWQRYQLVYDHSKGKISTFTYRRKKLANVLSWLSVGYGIRGKFLFLWIVPITSFLLTFNYIFWDCLGVTGYNEIAITGNWPNVMIYTLTSHVGVNIFTPGSTLGKTMFVVQSGFGLLTIAVFLRWFVRLALR